MFAAVGSERRLRVAFRRSKHNVNITTSSSIAPRMLPRIAPKIAVEMPCEAAATGAEEDVGGGAAEDDAGVADEDSIDEPGPINELDEATEDALDSEVGGSVIEALVRVGDDGGGVAVVGSGEFVGGGVNPP